MAPSGIDRGSPRGKYQPSKHLRPGHSRHFSRFGSRFENLPRGVKGNVQLGGRVRLDVDVGAARSRLTPAEMVDHGTIDTKPGGSGLLDHPQQWIFRKTALCFRIAAADVGVHAGKPYLADVLSHRGGWIEEIGR